MITNGEDNKSLEKVNGIQGSQFDHVNKMRLYGGSQQAHTQDMLRYLRHGGGGGGGGERGEGYIQDSMYRKVQKAERLKYKCYYYNHCYTPCIWSGRAGENL